MHSRKSMVVAALLAGGLAISVPTTGSGDEPDPAVEALLAQAQQRSGTRAETVPTAAPQVPPAAQRTRAVPADEPRRLDTILAVGGGVLVVVLAALGLTITFRSLGADMRSRRHRYRRRVRREPRSA